MAEELFFDRVLRRYNSSDLRGHDSKEINNILLHNNMLDDLVGSSLYNSKLFLLNSAVSHDLYHIDSIPRKIEDLRLPFPNMFFEFMDPLNADLLGIVKHPVHGMLVAKTSFQYEGSLIINLYYSDSLGNCLGDSSLSIDPYDFHLDREPRAFIIGTGFRDVSKSYQGNVHRFGHLALNSIDYINAHNVTIRRVDRDTRDPDEIGKINRKRIAKGKKPLPILKPYHWIEVKQGTTYEEKNRNGKELDYKEWVRGHFQTYHTSEGLITNWIEPYVRGPEDAPWKENRYKVLDDMLRKGPRY